MRIENDKVEVLEVFAYSCNHCFNFESNLEAFEKNKQYVLCGGRNRFLYNLTRIMSRQRVLEMTGGVFKKIAG